MSDNRYKVVQSQNIGALCRDVEIHQREGWIVSGSLVITEAQSGPLFLQPMTKDEASFEAFDDQEPEPRLDTEKS